jgi:ribokinase
VGLAVTAGTVVVVGSINMDLTVRVEELPRPGQTVLGGDVVHGTGGKGANQAVAASRAGATSLLIGAVGEDAAGAAALAALAAEGVDTSGVRRVPQRPTGTALIVVDRAGENQIAVASGANRNLTGSVVRELLKPLQAKRVVVLSSLEVSDDAVAAAAATARERGWRFILNPAPFRSIPDSVLGADPILTPNETEAASLLGKGAALDWSAVLKRPGAAASLVPAGLGQLVVTLGAAGALVVSGRRVAHVPAPRVEVIDSTGAGDVFNGILAAALAHGRGLEEAVRLAVVGGSLSTRAEGAAAATPSWGEIEAFLKAPTSAPFDAALG